MDLRTRSFDPKTGAGTLVGASVSLAVTASLPHPQQYGAPARVRPQLNVFPAEIKAKVNPAATGAGTRLDESELSPSWP